MMASRKTTVFIESNPLLDGNPSGVAKLLFSVIESLAKDEDFTNKYKITLIVPLRKKRNLKKWALPSNVKFRTLPLPLRVINLLDKHHLMFPLDAYFGGGVYLFPNYRRLPLLNAPSLTYVHDAAYKIHPETVLNINRIFLERVIPSAVKKSDTILTLSQQSRQELQSIFSEDKNKIEVIPCGIDQSRYQSSATDGEVKKVLSGIGVKDGQYILYVGNIEPRKNISYLIDIYVELVDGGAVPRFTELLLVGGGGWNNESLLERIKGLNDQGYSIKIPKNRISDDQLPILYKHSMITTLLSIHEGFGLTPLEALAAGSNVVVSDIPVLREVCGDVVSYAPLNNVSIAAKVFKRAVDQKISPRVIQKQLDKYSWSMAARLLMQKIDKINREKR